VIASSVVSETSVDDIGSRGYWIAICLLAVLLVASAFVVAGHAFFAADDFRWLSAVRDPEFSLLREWMPLEQRSWWSYRPLAMHTHFYGAQALFGLRPLAFYSIALLVHFGGGLLVLVLCRQLGFARPVAAFAGLLAVSRAPSMDVIYWASAFSYFAVATACLATMVLFSASQQREAPRLRALSLLSMGVALFCQEAAVVLPLVLYGIAWLQDGAMGADAVAWRSGGSLGMARRHARLARSMWPHAALAIAWLIWRFGVIAPFERSFNYQAVLGWNIARNSYQYAVWVAGSEGALMFGIGTVLGVPIVLWRREIREGMGLRALLALDLFCLTWIAASVVPFAPVRMIADRFAIAVEVPLCVLLAAQAAALWSVSGAGRRRLLQVVMLGLLVAAMPYGTLRAARDSPRGAAAYRVFEAMSARVDGLPDAARVVMLYGGPGQQRDAWAVRRETWTGTPLLRTLAPGRRLEMAFQDVGRDAPSPNFAPGARYYSLLTDGSVEEASREMLGDLFREGMSSRKPGASVMAAQRLALLLGSGAIETIDSMARGREGLQRQAIAQALLLIPDPKAERAAAELIPGEVRRAQLRRSLNEKWGMEGSE
jgi:hypothetical protein